MTHATQYLSEAKQIIDGLDAEAIEKMATLVEQTRERHGRLFILGVGGSAANASHAVNDFRKIVGIEAYAPTDNVSELTARTNDEGWATIFVEWLRVSRLNPDGPDSGSLCRRGKPREERQPEPGHCSAICPGGRYAGHRHRRQGRRLHGQGGRGMCDRADGQPRPHNASFRSVPGGGLAHAGFPPAAQGVPDQVGVGQVNRAVFLDRDGVLNRAFVRDGRPYPPGTVEELEILPGVAEALDQLRDAGFLLLVATNQPDVARGTQRREVVEAMNDRLLAALPTVGNPRLLRRRRRLSPPQAQPGPLARSRRGTWH